MIVLDTNLAAKAATTQYVNFDFESMANFNGQILAAGSNGLFLVSKSTNTDADAAIVAYFEIATIDFSLSSEKRLRSVYVTFEGTADLRLTINTEKSAAENYVIPGTGAGQKTRKVSINRSLHGVHWTFKIYSSGADFSLDNIKVLPIVRSHGVGQT